MKFLKKCFPLLLMTCYSYTICFGQAHVDEDLFGLFESSDTVKQDFTSPIKNATSDISTIISAGFIAYKSFISSQDNPSCIFTPSCSVYAVESIQKSGFILGWFRTFDRLSRCHGLVSHHHYPIDHENNRYYDPVH